MAAEDPLKTRILTIGPGAAGPNPVADMAVILGRGGVMAFPTETFYGLGAAAYSGGAVSRIFALKGRDPAKPLPVVASGLGMVTKITALLPSTFRILAGEFWPGPLTLVLRAAPDWPHDLTGPGGTVAVRVPPLAWLRDLTDALGQPLTATSANLSGEKELADPAEVRAVFEGKLDLIVDGGPTPGGAASTVLDLTGAEPRVLREGAVPVSRIRAALGA